MKAFKIFAIAAAAIILAAPCRASEVPEISAVPATAGTSTSTLTTSNGTAAGTALLALYNQYKSNGKVDFTNATNISNLITLATNVKGLTSNSNTKSFVKGLISGSKKLVNSSNSSKVISSLTKLANLDLSSLKSSAKSAATDAAKSTAESVISKITSSEAATNAKEVISAASTLNSLFKTLKK